mmetsp:Transcript_44255/g.130473  ORF Transcript_44255/g.130473 Transcript_44255/m.130473 type:complete len:321 (-) Transcript_44255:248-1210(-)
MVAASSAVAATVRTRSRCWMIGTMTAAAAGQMCRRSGGATRGSRSTRAHMTCQRRCRGGARTARAAMGRTAARLTFRMSRRTRRPSCCESLRPAAHPATETRTTRRTRPRSTRSVSASLRPPPPGASPRPPRCHNSAPLSSRLPPPRLCRCRRATRSCGRPTTWRASANLSWSAASTPAPPSSSTTSRATSRTSSSTTASTASTSPTACPRRQQKCMRAKQPRTSATPSCAHWSSSTGASRTSATYGARRPIVCSRATTQRLHTSAGCTRRRRARRYTPPFSQTTRFASCRTRRCRHCLPSRRATPPPLPPPAAAAPRTA